MSKEIKKDVVVKKHDDRPMSINKLRGLRSEIATVDEWLSGDIREDNTEKQPKVREPRNGVVIDCVKLNVRKRPATDANILTEIPAGTKVQIIDKESTKDFYHVCTATGIEGFCMKKFIEIK